MALVSEIIRDAYRESNLIAISADPTANEQTEGLRLLNRYIASIYGIEVGEKYQEVLIGRNNIERPSGYPWYSEVPPYPDWFVPQNARLVLNLTQAATVHLDPTPEDGARFAVLDKSSNLATYNLTVEGNGRTIGGADSVVLNTDDISYEYVYRADTGDWTRVNPLVAADTFPFPREFEDLFVIGLAARINPRYGTGLDAQSGATYNRLMRIFRSRYRTSEEVGVDEGLLRLSTNKRYAYGSDRDGTEFKTGYPR